MTNFGTLYVRRERNVVGFQVAHEELHREALLTVRETRNLISELEKLVADIERQPPAVKPVVEDIFG